MTRPRSQIKDDIAHPEKWAAQHRADGKHWAADFHDERLPNLRAELRRAEVCPANITDQIKGDVHV